MQQITRCFIQNKEGNYLLVKHKNKTHWVLPGGHIEKGEDIFSAIKREIKEELGIKVKFLGDKKVFTLKNIKEMINPFISYKIEYKNKKGAKEKRLEYIFIAKIKSGEIIRTQIEEIDEYKFFTKEEIMSIEAIYPQIKEILKLM